MGQTGLPTASLAGGRPFGPASSTGVMVASTILSRYCMRHPGVRLALPPVLPELLHLSRAGNSFDSRERRSCRCSRCHPYGQSLHTAPSAPPLPPLPPPLPPPPTLRPLPPPLLWGRERLGAPLAAEEDIWGLRRGAGWPDQASWSLWVTRCSQCNPPPPHPPMGTRWLPVDL
jgi:hypothetical protein